MTKALRRRFVYRKAAVAVEFYLVEPVLAFRKVLDGERIHGFDKADFSGWDGCWFPPVSTLGMLRYSLERPEANCEPVEASIPREYGANKKTSLNFR